jgi:AcrR family transcriptional regulator
MRKDAERNREMLIAAARDVMRNEGGDAPMELIAERANVTRGTLYRNFPHRQAIYEAVLQSDLAIIAHRMMDDNDSHPLAFIRHMAELMMLYDRFLVALVTMPDYDSKKNEKRMISIMAAPFASAKRKGVLRHALTGADVLTLCRMLASNWRLDKKRSLKATLDRRLALITPALAPATVPSINRRKG